MRVRVRVRVQVRVRVRVDGEPPTSLERTIHLVHRSRCLRTGGEYWVFGRPDRVCLSTPNSCICICICISRTPAAIATSHSAAESCRDPSRAVPSLEAHSRGWWRAPPPVASQGLRLELRASFLTCFCLSVSLCLPTQRRWLGACVRETRRLWSAGGGRVGGWARGRARGRGGGVVRARGGAGARLAPSARA